MTTTRPPPTGTGAGAGTGTGSGCGAGAGSGSGAGGSIGSGSGVITGSGSGSGTGSGLGVDDSGVGVGLSGVLDAGLESPGTVICGPEEVVDDATEGLVVLGGVACSVGAAQDAISTAQAAAPANKAAGRRRRALMPAPHLFLVGCRHAGVDDSLAEARSCRPLCHRAAAGSGHSPGVGAVRNGGTGRRITVARAGLALGGVERIADASTILTSTEVRN